MGRLYPKNLPLKSWTSFAAEGFRESACGLLFGPEDASCGMPLGGIGTGFVDLNPNGTLGRCSLFNSFAPPREFNVPYLAVSTGGKNYCISTATQDGFSVPAEMSYWGHYPIADIECEFGSDFSAGVRAWSPFVLGEAIASNTPVALIEVRLRNNGVAKKPFAITLSFPGPSIEEAAGTLERRDIANAAMKGVEVSGQVASYLLACLSGHPVHTDQALWSTGRDAERGASITANVEVRPDEEEVVQFLLAWYAPRWAGSSAHHYIHAYARRFSNVLEVAEAAVKHRSDWMSRVLAWQEAIFAASELPVWLRDQLVNSLHTIAKDSFWAATAVPRESWYGEVGLFALTESPRTTPHVCNPSDWYGSLPIVYFFPELMQALLRTYVHFQLPTGEVPLGVGEGSDLCRPTYQVLRVMNSCVHVHLIDRIWQRHSERAVLSEFYPSARAALQYMRSLDRDNDGLPELDSDPAPEQFYGSWPWFGVSPYVAGFWILAVQMMQRMASAVGDESTRELCADWVLRARQTLERELWNGKYYLLFSDNGRKQRSDTILANQLVGQWCSHLHGLERLVRGDRAQSVLSYVTRLCAAPTHAGLMNAVKPDGELDLGGPPHSDGIFTGECLCVAATMMYEKLIEEAAEYARRMMQAIVVDDGVGWELPNVLAADGTVRHGDDFYQMMILWALPLALHGESIADSCSAGFVHRILNAAQSPSLRQEAHAS